jgi:serine/threonine protein kinase
MSSSSERGAIPPEHVSLLAAAADGKLTVDQEAKLEELLNRIPAYRLELDRLLASPDASRKMPSACSSADTPLPALVEAMKHWMDNPGWKQEQHENTHIPFESESIVLVRKLGQGGMGVVYEAFDKHLSRPVAVKFLSERWSKNSSSRERLLGEAQAAAQVQHENIVSIHSVHPTGIVPYIVLQYVRGETLQQLIDRSGPLEGQKLEDLSIQLTRGLVAAHQCGLIHRDLKPENILLEKDTQIARIADFGLAQRLGASKLTAAGELTGTPTYMSPEQTRGETLDHRSDLFSLGSLLYCAAAGRSPFDDDDPYVVMDRIRNESPKPLATIRSDLNPVWVAAIDRLLKKDRDDRFESAEQLLALLTMKSTTQTTGYKPLVWTAALASCVALIATIALLIVLFRPQRLPQESISNQPSEKNGALGISTAPHQEPISFLVKGRSERVNSLAQAVELAANDSTIMVFGTGELECESIRIREKALQIIAVNPGQVLLKAKPIPAKMKEPFLSTDTDLTISGLKLYSERSGAIESPVQSLISIEGNGKLILNECTLTSQGTSACVLTNGKEIRAVNCNLVAEQGFAVAGSFSKLQLKMVQCSIIARGCLELISNERNANPTALQPYAMLDHCTFVGERALRMVHRGPATDVLQLDFRNSVLDCTRQIEVTSIAQRQSLLLDDDKMLDYLGRTVQLNMDRSLYRGSMDFFGTSDFRNKSKTNPRIVTDWKQWAGLFGMSMDSAMGIDLETLRVSGNAWDFSKLPKEFQHCGVSLKRP